MESNSPLTPMLNQIPNFVLAQINNDIDVELFCSNVSEQWACPEGILALIGELQFQPFTEVRYIVWITYRDGSPGY